MMQIFWELLFYIIDQAIGKHRPFFWCGTKEGSCIQQWKLKAFPASHWGNWKRCTGTARYLFFTRSCWLTVMKKGVDNNNMVVEGHDNGRRWGWEMVTMGIDDRGPWWRWEVVRMGSGEKREGLTLVRNYQGKWWSGQDGKGWRQGVVRKVLEEEKGNCQAGWWGKKVVRKGSGAEGKCWMGRNPGHKRCVFPCKVGAGNEKYLACAAVAGGVVPGAIHSLYVFGHKCLFLCARVQIAL